MLKKNTTVKQHVNRGISLGIKGDTKGSIEAFKMAVDLDPKCADAYYNLGILFEESAEYEKAIKMYEKTIEIDPMSINAYYNLADILADKKSEHNEAIKIYQQASLVFPSDAKLYQGAATTYLQLGLAEKAIEMYDKTLELDSGPGKYLGFADHLSVSGDNIRAIECYNKLLALYPDAGNIYLNKANSLLALGEWQQAIECYDKLIEMDSNCIEAYYQKAMSIALLGKQEISEKYDVIKYCNKIIELDPNYINAYSCKAAALQFLGCTEEAEQCVALMNSIQAHNTVLNQEMNNDSDWEDMDSSSEKSLESCNKKVMAVFGIKYDNPLLNKEKILEAFKVKHSPIKLSHLLTLTNDLVQDQVNPKHLSSVISNKEAIAHTNEFGNVSFGQELKNILDNSASIEDTLSVLESLIGLAPNYL